MEKRDVPKITPELAKKMKDSLVALYSHQFGVECTYEEFENRQKPAGGPGQQSDEAKEEG